MEDFGSIGEVMKRRDSWTCLFATLVAATSCARNPEPARTAAASAVGPTEIQAKPTDETKARVADDPAILLCYNASGMRGGAADFVKSFLGNYVPKKIPYPLFAMMMRARAEPRSKADTDLLGKRGPISFVGDGVMSNDATGLGVCTSSIAGVCTEPTFDVLLDNQVFAVQALVPNSLTVDWRSVGAANVKFEFRDPIKLRCGEGCPLQAKEMSLRSIEVSENQMVYVVTTVITEILGPQDVGITLSFEDACEH